MTNLFKCLVAGFAAATLACLIAAVLVNPFINLIAAMNLCGAVVSALPLIDEQ